MNPPGEARAAVRAEDAQRECESASAAARRRASKKSIHCAKPRDRG